MVVEDGQLSLAAADAIVAGKHAEEDEHQAETAVQSRSFRSTVRRERRDQHTYKTASTSISSREAAYPCLRSSPPRLGLTAEHRLCTEPRRPITPPKSALGTFCKVTRHCRVDGDEASAAWTPGWGVARGECTLVMVLRMHVESTPLQTTRGIKATASKGRLKASAQAHRETPRPNDASCTSRPSLNRLVR